MVSRLDQSGAAAYGCRASRQSKKSVARGLALGHDLLLWNVLVAYVPDDPLRAISPLARVSTALIANYFRGTLPCCFLRAAVQIDYAVWDKGIDPGPARLGFI